MKYLFYNGPMQTSSPPTKVAISANTLITLLQIAPLVSCKLVEWGISLDAFAAAIPGTIEIIETDGAATVSNFAAADITKVTHPQDITALSTLFTLTTTGSGYTAGAEGTIATVRNLDAPQLVAPTSELIKQVPLGGEATMQSGKFTRIRVKFAGAVNALCYMIVEV